jgi:hypothetical protein
MAHGSMVPTTGRSTPTAPARYQAPAGQLGAPKLGATRWWIEAAVDGAAPLRIFVSYRRADTRDIAGRLHDRLADRYGDANVIEDVESFEPGLDFVEEIGRAIDRCDVLLALIGPNWLRAPGAPPDDPDWVAFEVGSALERGIRVIPVLVNGAVIPRSDQLPDALEPLVRRNAVRLDSDTFSNDIGPLMRVLDRVDRRPVGDPVAPGPLGPPGPEPAHPVRRPTPRVPFLLRGETPEPTAALRRLIEAPAVVPGEDVVRTSPLPTRLRGSWGRVARTHVRAWQQRLPGFPSAAGSTWRLHVELIGARERELYRLALMTEAVGGTHALSRTTRRLSPVGQLSADEFSEFSWLDVDADGVIGPVRFSVELRSAAHGPWTLWVFLPPTVALFERDGIRSLGQDGERVQLVTLR